MPLRPPAQIGLWSLGCLSFPATTCRWYPSMVPRFGCFHQYLATSCVPHLFQWHSFVLGVALVYRGGNPWMLCTFCFSVISASWMESRFSLAGGVNQPPGQSQSTASLNVDPIQARGDLLAKAILQVDGTNKNKSRMKEWRKRWASQNPMNHFRGATFPNIHSLLQLLLCQHLLYIQCRWAASWHH